ncbi:hypothetical protein HHL11_06950 [Ramlibacter sp. G-1-2-2]|uniref:Uncharacterized protein n=1 Tax=Ramlibacter agri TaxID=2728837 RepID=A0A848H1M8_9BURK|nr:hypothetical protein [Ramlibacter agri]
MVLSLGSGILQLERKGTHSASLSFLRIRRGREGAPTLQCTETFAHKEGELQAALDRALVGVGLAEARSQAGAKLEVALGFQHSRVAVMTLAGLRETEANLSRAVEAWAQTRLNLNPHEHVLRWERLPRGGRYLVSCVRRDGLNHLREFTTQRRMQLASVRPAVLEALDAVNGPHRKDRLRRDLVWTEGEAPGSTAVAQVFAFAGGSLQCDWRGSMQSPDGLLRRLHASHALEPGELIRRSWPM